MGNILPPVFTNQLLDVGARKKGFAGQISDTSLLDVETIVIDQTAGDTANGLLFRAGTVAIVTAINANTGTRKGKPAVASDFAAADTLTRAVAISFSHDSCNQHGEIYFTNPDVGGVVGVKPANGVNTGRIWMLLNGAKPGTTGVSLVGVANIPAAGAFDATKPFTNGAVKVAADAANAIPGWRFTGHVDIDPATGYQIAEVECSRA